MPDLIDTTEMYLRTIYELEEEGVVPLRARIAERLAQTGPTVSQTVARMQRDGLLSVEGDRHLELSPTGRSLAMRVMRKHRLAECLLVDVIGLELEQVHEEACRWEHVMSEAVERRLLDLLKHPTRSPFGNLIPGLEELGDLGELPGADELLPVSAVPGLPAPSPAVWRIRRFGEQAQDAVELIAILRAAGVGPGALVAVDALPSGVRLTSLPSVPGRAAIDVPQATAEHIFVTPAEATAAG